MNAVERKPVPTRVLNPNASEESYKLKQRSYRKTKLKKKKNLAPDITGALMSSVQTAAPNWRRPIDGAQTYPNPRFKTVSSQLSPRNPSKLTHFQGYFEKNKANATRQNTCVSVFI